MSSLPTQELPEFCIRLDLFEVTFQTEQKTPDHRQNQRGLPPPPSQEFYIPKPLQQEEQGEKGSFYQMGLLCRDLKLCNFTLLLPNNHNVHLLRNNYWRIQNTNRLSHKVATAYAELGS